VPGARPAGEEVPGLKGEGGKKRRNNYRLADFGVEMS